MRFSFSVVAMLLALLGVQPLSAQETVCARVSLVIEQELTLERQAFVANMKINNGLDTISLENVRVDVIFEDEDGISAVATSDPDATDADFYIAPPTMDGISAVDGTGTVAPESTADIDWLIIPVPGSGGVLPSGKLYFVGARLTYFANGEEWNIDVTPDSIYVKPLPELKLDYFLPREVIADDAFTPEIEEPIPFTLGVRVTNTGDGVAQAVNIESAQPRITDNEQGLLVNFEIIGSTVQDQPVSPSLLIDFGDIQTNSAKMGRWQMTTTLSGEFTRFDASFRHSDELGGTLTSLLNEDASGAYTLLRDVLVDVPGRDNVRDFLGEAPLRLYESNGLDDDVNDISGPSSIALTNQAGPVATYTVTSPAQGGFSYIKLPDAEDGQKTITSAVRADGKQMRLENVWLSQERDGNNGWNYFINIFDANSNGGYTILMDTPVLPNRPPNLQFIPNRDANELQQVSFIVEASDPEGGIPVLTAAPVPTGAAFNDQGDGTAIFDWTPPIGSEGSYPIRYTASDGLLETAQLAVITVGESTFVDTDGDGMDDNWEMMMFGTLARDGTGDYDGDGVSDLDEFLNGTNPADPPSGVVPIPLFAQILLALMLLALGTWAERRRAQAQGRAQQ